MRKLLASALALVMIAALCGYGFWSQQRPEGHYLSDLRIELALNHGVPGDRGNLLGIEPLLFPSDYQNLQRLHRKLAAYLEQARAQGLVGPRTVVVLPEHIGTWLWARGEKNELYQVTQSREAQQWLELSNPLRYALAMVAAEGDDRRADAHLRMKAEQMAADYQQLFGGLAKEFGVTLVAGSIVLPAPYVQQGVLHAGRGALFNSSVVFAGDGSLLGQPQRQQYPDSDMRRYVQEGRDYPLQVVQTPPGAWACWWAVTAGTRRTISNWPARACSWWPTRCFSAAKAAGKPPGVATATRRPVPGWPCSAARSVSKRPGNA